jgi:hypothetical protein
VDGNEVAEESSYFEVAAEDNEGSYMQIQQSLRYTWFHHERAALFH